jgi:hypothetical protein
MMALIAPAPAAAVITSPSDKVRVGDDPPPRDNIAVCIIPLNINWMAVIGATVPAWTPTPRYQPDTLVGNGRPS